LKCNFPDLFVRKVVRVYGDEFVSAFVKNKLMVLYSSEDKNENRLTNLDNGQMAAMWPPYLNKRKN
jgi:hypothetical protein